MIRARALTLLISLVGFLPSAHAAESARELVDDCRSLQQGTAGSGDHVQIPFTKQALLCWGYMQAMQDLSVLADEDGTRILDSCPPETATLLQLIDAFLAYADARSDRAGMPGNGALAVSQALQQAFPCPPPEQGKSSRKE
jgi:hypothetical protein